MKYKLHILLITLGAYQTVYSQTQEPPEFATLKQSWTRARKVATDPIDKKYVEALIAMKDKFTKAGKLAEALIIDSEIRSLSGQPALNPSDAANSLAPSSVPGLKFDPTGYTVVYMAKYSWQFIADMKVIKRVDGAQDAELDYLVRPDGRIGVGGDILEIKSKNKALLYKGEEDKKPTELLISKTK